MAAVMSAPSTTRLLLSGNEAVARAVWEAGCRVAAAYPGTPATEILEALSHYPDLHTQWSVNEKVSMEVALGASMTGARAFCSMKHVGLNVASDCLMTMTLTGVEGGLVIAVADDVGMSSSQNEQDSRYWGRFAHLPILEPADSQEAYAMTLVAFALSEQFRVPVLLRMTTRICHVKGLVTPGERETHEPKGFVKDPQRWVMVPAHAKGRIPGVFQRERDLRDYSETSALNILEPGTDRRVGFVTSGPAYMHVRETFPDAPVLKLGMSYPWPLEKMQALAAQCDQLLVVEETEQLLETELKAAGIACRGKDLLPNIGELSPQVLTPAVDRLLGKPVPEMPAVTAPKVFPRPPTLCASCPHMGIYYTLSQLKNIIITRFSDLLAESKIPAIDLAAQYDELSTRIQAKVNGEFGEYGLEVSKLLIENVSFPPEVEQAIDKRNSMGVIGNMQNFMQYQAATSMESAAKNPSGGASDGIGMGMGFAMANQMAQMNQPQHAAQQGGGAPPPFPAGPQFFVAQNATQAGPFSMETLQTMASQKNLTAETLVWKQGLAAWVKAGEVPELLSLFGQPPPIPK